MRAIALAVVALAALLAGASAPSAVARSCEPSIEGFAYSATGRWMTYEHRTRSCGFQLVLARADGSRKRVIGPGGGMWAPRGNRLAYTTWQNGSEQLSVMRPGEKPRPLVERPPFDLTWAPGGSALLLAEYGSRVSDPRIEVVRIDGSVADLGVGVLPRWSPRGDRVVYQTADGIHIVGADGSGAYFLTKGGYPAWSPSGDWISFEGGDQSGDTLDVIRPNGSEERLLTPEHYKLADLSVVWSPTGREAAAVSHPRVYGSADSWTTLVDLSTWQRFGPFPGFPVWSPTGTRLALVKRVSGPGLVVSNADGSHRRVVKRQRVILAVWSPVGQRLLFTAKDGRVFVATAGGAHVREIGPALQPAWTRNGQNVTYIGGNGCTLKTYSVTKRKTTTLVRC